MQRTQRWRQFFGPRTIVHIDMDAFFAQIEMLDRPELRDKPVVVGGHRDSRRGVVSTCSYEARTYGIHSAMPIQKAVALCPHAVFLPTRMERYEEASRAVRRILHAFTPLVEPISIDEAFLDMTGCEHFYKTPQHMGEALKQAVYEATELTASVGIAPNKFLAKLASDKEKPNGLVVLGQKHVPAFLRQLPVTDLWGVGPKTARILHNAGIYKVVHLQRRDPHFIRHILGENLGDHVLSLANGRDDRPVLPDEPAKSLGKETTFSDDVKPGPELNRHLARLCSEVGWRLRKKGLYARTVTVKIRYPDFSTYSKRQSVEHAFQDDDTLYQHATKLLTSFQLRRPLRLLGVYVSQLQRYTQGSLLRDHTHERLSEVLDSVNEKLGRYTIRKGRELK